MPPRFHAPDDAPSYVDCLSPEERVEYDGLSQHIHNLQKVIVTMQERRRRLQWIARGRFAHRQRKLGLK